VRASLSVNKIADRKPTRNGMIAFKGNLGSA